MKIIIKIIITNEIKIKIKNKYFIIINNINIK